MRTSNVRQRGSGSPQNDGSVIGDFDRATTHFPLSQKCEPADFEASDGRASSGRFAVALVPLRGATTAVVRDEPNGAATPAGQSCQAATLINAPGRAAAAKRMRNRLALVVP